MTALMYAAAYNQLEFARFLLARGADRTLKSVLRKAEFMECLKLGNVELRDYHQGYG